MSYFKLSVGFLFAFLMLSQNAFATHVGGGNISYTCTGNPNEYLITFSIYRDCSSPVGIPGDPVINFSNSCGFVDPGALTLTIVDTLTLEISQICNESLGLSTCSGGTLPGYEQYVFTGLVTFPGPCDSWNLDYELSNRNTSTNVVGQPPFHITASIFSITDDCNNSPVVVTDTPIPYFCVNQPQSLNFGVVEVDGDELQFSFVNALGGGGGNVAYQAGFSATEPIPGISIDPSTGLVTFLPTLQGNFIVAVLITELNVAGEIVGTMVHDIQFVVDNCLNESVLPPSTGGNFDNSGTDATFTGGNTIAMCAGDQFCIDIVFTDPDNTPGDEDTLTLSTNALDILPGATFTQTGTNPATGTLCWAYTDGYTGNLVSITAVDDACDVYSISSFVINLDIPPPLNASPDFDICGDMVANLEAYGTAPVVWSVISGDPLLVGTNFTCNPCSLPIVSPTVTTVYEVVEGSSCNLTDQVTVNVSQNIGGITTTIVTPDTVLCPGDCFNVDVIAEEVFSSVSPISNTASAQYPLNDNSSVTSYINIFGLNMTTITIGSIQSVCVDIEHDFLADVDIYLVSPIPGSVQFLLSSDNGGSSNDYNNTCFTIDATDQVNLGVGPFSGNYVPEGGVLSGALLGVPANGSWSLLVSDDGLGTTGTLNSWTLTLNDDIPNIGPASTVSWTSDVVGGVDGITDSTDPMTEICGVATGEYTLTAYDINNCWIDTSFTITLLTFGDPGLDSSMNICKESAEVDLFSYVGGTPDAGGIWRTALGDTITGLILADTIVNGSVFEYFLTVGCPISSYVTVNIIELTEAHTFVNSDCQILNGSITVTPIGNLGPVTYSIDNGTTTQISSLFDGLLGNVPAESYTILLEDSIGCQTTFTQNILDINQPIITGTPVVNNICNTGTDGEIEVNGTNLSFYSIDNGVTIQTSNTFTGLAVGFYSVIGYSSDPATTNACSYFQGNIEITEPDALDVYDLNATNLVQPTPPDLYTSCPGDDVILTVANQGGMGNSILTWVDAIGTVLGSGNTITINPTDDIVVTVVITEGTCPSYEESTIIKMPIPIYPSMTTDINDGCFPITVNFINESTNPLEIQTTNWVFSANNSADTNGNDTTITTYDQVGVFDVTMTVTSIYGCVYDTTYVAFIETYDYPVANFTYTPIPPTVYEPEVVLTSLSSDDVVQWNWSIDGGTPTGASTEDVAVSFPQGIPGIYPVVLKVWNEHGCLDSLVGQVEVINDVTIYAPNIFTPDGDEFNETWRVYMNGIDINDFHVLMYNRWGEVVWESFDPVAEWDGSYNSTGKINDGTYVWILNVKDSYTDKKYEFKGSVTISR